MIPNNLTTSEFVFLEIGKNFIFVFNNELYKHIYDDGGEGGARTHRWWVEARVRPNVFGCMANCSLRLVTCLARGQVSGCDGAGHRVAVARVRRGS